MLAIDTLSKKPDGSTDARWSAMLTLLVSPSKKTGRTNLKGHEKLSAYWQRLTNAQQHLIEHQKTCRGQSLDLKFQPSANNWLVISTLEPVWDLPLCLLAWEETLKLGCIKSWI